jgi:hypothetical protein
MKIQLETLLLTLACKKDGTTNIISFVQQQLWRLLWHTCVQAMTTFSAKSGNKHKCNDSGQAMICFQPLSRGLKLKQQVEVLSMEGTASSAIIRGINAVSGYHVRTCEEPPRRGFAPFADDPFAQPAFYPVLDFHFAGSHILSQIVHQQTTSRECMQSAVEELVEKHRTISGLEIHFVSEGRAFTEMTRLERGKRHLVIMQAPTLYTRKRKRNESLEDIWD